MHSAGQLLLCRNSYTQIKKCCKFLLLDAPILLEIMISPSAEGESWNCANPRRSSECTKPTVPHKLILDSQLYCYSKHCRPLKSIHFLFLLLLKVFSLIFLKCSRVGKATLLNKCAESFIRKINFHINQLYVAQTLFSLNITYYFFS